MKPIERIIREAKTKESWSRDRKYNYGPIEYLHRNLVSHINELGITKYLNLLYSNYKEVTDYETFLASEFKKSDIFVDINSIIISVQRAFPDVQENTIIKWMNEHREEHHVFIW